MALQELTVERYAGVTDEQRVLLIKGPLTIEVAISFADGLVRGRIEDRALRVGNAEVKLSEIEIARFTPKAEIRTADSRTLEGAIAPPNEVMLTGGGQTIRLDLRKAVAIRTTNAGDPGSVTCALVSKRGTEELACANLPLYRAGAARPSAGPHTTGRRTSRGDRRH